MSLENIKSTEFSTLSENYFNSAYFGPIPDRSRKAGVEAINCEANPKMMPFSQWKQIPDDVRSQIARLLQVSSDQISHHCAVSDVISTISLGYPFQSGDVVALLDGDFPSNVLPWMFNNKKDNYDIVKMNDSVFRDVDAFKKTTPKKHKSFEFFPCKIQYRPMHRHSSHWGGLS
ncbi:MAG: hypothetical protein R2827_04900 [Bdellovibrionales bacterium]